MNENVMSETPLPKERQWWNRHYEIVVWQWIGVWMVMILTVFGGILGFMNYISDSERRACETAVEARRDLRGVILGIYDAIEYDGENELIQALRITLNTDYAPLSFEQCMRERYGK